MTIAVPRRVEFRPHKGQWPAWESQARYIAIIAGCIAGETRILDPVTGEQEAVAELHRRGEMTRVLTWNGPEWAMPPFIKGTADLFEVRLANGRRVVTTQDHLLLTPAGWQQLAQLSPGDSVLASELSPRGYRREECPYEFGSYADRCSDIPQGSQAGYRYAGHFCDALLPLAVDSDLAPAPLRDGVLPRTHRGRVDDQGIGAGYSRAFPACDRPSTPGSLRHSGHESVAVCSPARETNAPSRGRSVSPPLSHGSSDHLGPSQQPYHGADGTGLPASGVGSRYPLPSGHSAPVDGSSLVPAEQRPRFHVAHSTPQSPAAWLSKSVSYTSPSATPFGTSYYTPVPVPIASIQYLRTDVYYDLTVPESAHYWAEGMWHHNTGGGKTYFSPRWLYRELKTRGDGAQALVVSPIYRMSTRIIVPEYTKFFCNPPDHDTDPGLGIGKFHKADMYFELKDGPNSYTINLASADNPSSLEGQHVHAIVLDEAGLMGRMAWEVAQRRVGYHEGRILIPTTPYSINWLKSDVLDRYTDGDPYYFVQTFPSVANPHYSQQEFEKRKAEMSPARFAMMYEGRFERPEGLVYPDFSEQEHVIDAFDIPADWRRVAALDLGWNNPTAAVAGAVDGDDVLYIWGEYYEPERTVTQHVSALATLGFIDDTAEWYFDPAGKALAEEYKAQGLYMTPADNDVLAGIAEVTARLRTNRIKFFRGLGNTFQELSTYRWQVNKATEQPTDKPVKERDHLMDALRYLCMAVRQRRRAQGFEMSM